MSALRSGMDRKTAGKYLSQPEQLRQPRPARDWRTRVDPLTEIWPEAELRLRTAPELEAKALFEHLQLLRSEPFPATLLRTFQRRVRQWRLVHGPAPEVIFPQMHSPGEVLQLDWTHAKELAVSIAGHPLDHLLCQAVLPYSNWQWATRCQSESLLSLRAGLQAALFRLGKVPKLLQIDNSSAATHQISGEGKRDFNPEFLSLTGHYGLAVRTIHVGCPNENGDVESHNGHLKRRLEQHLLLRGYRDFVTEAAYDQFVAEVLAKANSPRTAKVAEELAVMRELPPTRLCEYDEVECQVCSHSTIRVKRVTYSVPARFIGRRVRARVYEQRLEVYHGPDQIAQIARQPGRQAVIDYRHVIQALLRKPGGFARYRYREELFPSSTYRRAYDRLVQDHGPGPGELEYLRLLKLTADLGSSAIEGLLSEFLSLDSPPWRTATLRNVLCPPTCVELVEPAVDFSVYDAFLGAEAPMSLDPLAGLLRSFKLPTMASLYAATLEQAEQNHWGYRKFLQHLCESEAEDRRQRRVARLLKQSGLPDGKSLGNLDEALLPEKIRRQLPTLLEGGFVERGDNLLAFGLPGRGKSHFVAALSRELIIRHGHTVLFIPTFKLVQKLLTAKKALKLEALLKKLDRYSVVVLDDIGYVQQDREEMEVLFTFLAERYERRSVMITSPSTSVI